jgi:hypothetical protein
MFRGGAVIMLCMLVAEGIMFGQKAPGVPDHPWDTLEKNKTRFYTDVYVRVQIFSPEP